MALLVAALPAAAQDQLWIAQLGTSRNEVPRGAAPDGSGGVYLIGDTDGSLGGPIAGKRDVWLAHFDSAGDQTWIRQFGSSEEDYVYGAAPDGSGGVYVTGYTEGSLGGPNAGDQDAWLAHYDSHGNQTWFRQFGTIASDAAFAAASDGAGGVYVSGSTRGSLGGPNSGSEDVWLAHYDSAGNQTWIRQFGTVKWDQSRAAAPDGSGGVYVSGLTFGSLGGPNAGDSDAWLAHHDSAGNQTWVRQLGTSYLDWTYATSSDESGGVYVGGSTLGSLGGPNLGSFDIWLAHYDSAGTQTWKRQVGTDGGDLAYASASDGSGGVYVSGYTSGSLGGPSAGDIDAVLAHFDSAGNQTWIRQVGTDVFDGAFVATEDGSGGVYVGGNTTGSLGGPSAGERDAWLARYDGQCGSSSYCTASTTSIPGCQPAINGTGSASLANPNGFVVSSGNVPGGNIGICFFGANGFASTPFGTLGGQICVQGPFFRSAPKQSGGTNGVCNGSFNFLLSDLINASPIITQGAVIHAEIWARDPANADGFLLSDGLVFTVCP